MNINKVVDDHLISPIPVLRERIAVLEAWRDTLLAEVEALTRERDQAHRAMEWRDISEAPEVSRFGFLAGHVGSERIDHCFHRDTAIRLMHTHYRELPPPPEGV